jgi:hypothetical protein
VNKKFNVFSYDDRENLKFKLERGGVPDAEERAYLVSNLASYRESLAWEAQEYGRRLLHNPGSRGTHLTREQVPGSLRRLRRSRAGLSGADLLGGHSPESGHALAVTIFNDRQRTGKAFSLALA